MRRDARRGPAEPEAYEFAVALRLPPEEFDRTVGAELTLRRARSQAGQLGVRSGDRQAARDRQLITASRYTSLYKQISARGWRRDEADAIPLEQPTVWPAALVVHRTRHGYTDDELADLLPRNFASRLRVVGGPRRQPSRALASARGGPASSSTL